MDRWKSRGGKSDRGETKKWEDQRREKMIRMACDFSSLIWPDGSAPAALARLLGWPSGATNHWENKVNRDFPTSSRTCIFLWRETHFQVKNKKTPQLRSTFCDVEKVHAVGARSTIQSQNVQSTSASEHVWKFRCQKSAGRCGAKHISKSKCTKHTNVGPLLEVQMSKKCTPFWREARFQVKSVKNWRVRTFDVQMWKKRTLTN